MAVDIVEGSLMSRSTSVRVGLGEPHQLSTFLKVIDCLGMYELSL